MLYILTNTLHSIHSYRLVGVYHGPLVWTVSFDGVPKSSGWRRTFPWLCGQVPHASGRAILRKMQMISRRVSCSCLQGPSGRQSKGLRAYSHCIEGPYQGVRLLEQWKQR